MVENLQRTGLAGNPNPTEFTSDQLKEPTLQNADDWYTIFEVQADNTKTYAAGFGPMNENLNSDGWSDLDLQTKGTSPEAISGSLRFRVYRDSSKEQLVAQSGTYSLNSLRSAVNSGRKDKALIPAMASVVPRNQGYLTVEVSPAGKDTGKQVGSANSATDQGIAYSELSF